LKIELTEANKSEINNKNTTIEKLKTELKNLTTLKIELTEANKSKINNKNTTIEKLKTELKNLTALNKKLTEENIPFYEKFISKKNK